MKVRRRARSAALQALFEVDCVGHDPEGVLKHRLEETLLPANAQEFSWSLFQGVLGNLESLDSEIGRYATERPVEQIAIVDRNILRMACYEILIAHDTPIKVAINEAVELAKLYGSDSSSRFVNGVLGSLAARLESSGLLPKTAHTRRGERQ